MVKHEPRARVVAAARAAPPAEKIANAKKLPEPPATLLELCGIWQHNCSSQIALKEIVIKAEGDRVF